MKNSYESLLWRANYVIVIGLLCLGTQMALASPIVNWASWLTAGAGWDGTAAGTLLTSTGEITVSYQGELWGAQILAGRGVNGGVDANYWTDYTSTAPSPYIGDGVPDAPTSSDILALTGVHGITNTLTFSAPVTDPVMAFVSVGRPGIEVDYAFDAPFDVVNSGRGWWSTYYNILPTGGLFTQVGNTLRGEEGDGVIQFHGTFSSISWTSTSGVEVWQGFTIGVDPPGPPAAVPEPGSLALLALAMGCLAFTQRKQLRYPLGPGSVFQGR
jgi:hypothetical protein